MTLFLGHSTSKDDVDLSRDTLFFRAQRAQGIHWSADPLNPADNTGVVDARAALATIDGFGKSGVLVPGTYRVASNMTLSSAWHFHPGAMLKPDSGVDITIAGPVTAGLHQWIDTSAGGRVVFSKGSVKEVHPHWWGSIASFATTCEKMLAAFNTGTQAWNPQVRMPAGDYNVSATMTGPNSLANVVFVGDGNRSTRIRWTGAVSGAVLKFINPRRIKFWDIGVINAGTKPAYGVQFDSQLAGKTAAPYYCGAHDCLFGGDALSTMAVGVGYTSEDGSDANNEQGKYDHCEFYNCDKGLHTGHSNSLWHTLEDCDFVNCGAGISNYVSGGTGGSWTATRCRFTDTNTTHTCVEVGASRYPLELVNCMAESDSYLVTTPTQITANLAGSQLRILGGLYYIRSGGDGLQWNSSSSGATPGQGHGKFEMRGVTIIAGAGAQLRFAGTDRVLIEDCSINWASPGLYINGPTIVRNTGRPGVQKSMNAIASNLGTGTLLFENAGMADTVTLGQALDVTTATPSVMGMPHNQSIFVTPSGAYSLTNLTNAAMGQIVRLNFVNANTTVTNSTSFRLNGSTNWTPTAGSTLTLERAKGSDGIGPYWQEIGRMQR